VDITQPVVNTP